MTFAIIHADCRTVMANMGDETVDAVVCDPPYHLTSIVKRFGPGCAPQQYGTDGAFARAARGFMGQTWDGGDIAFDVDLWREVLRVLKPGGYLLAFGGSRTYHRMACAVEDAGFEIRDQVLWLYGSGMPKSKNQGDGHGTSLKPAHEPIVMARKPLVGTVAANRAAYGTGAINIDGCLVPPGRFPANVIIDGSDEVVALFPTKAGAASPVSGQEPSHMTDRIYGRFLGRVPGAFHADEGSAARFFYCAKASVRDREEGCEGLADGVLARSNLAQTLEAAGEVVEEAGGGFNAARIRKNVHPTVKPTDLMRYLVRLVTPAGGLVFDPFTGSGSTGKAAMLEGFRFIGAEMTADYVPIAHARCYYGWHVRAYGTPPPAAS
jgi:site-specific DNA-methyltransferase (adenine-specific)